MKSNVTKALRNIIFEREGYTCALCDNPANDIHHVVPRARGGRTTQHNLSAICRLCHAKLHHEEYLTPELREDLEIAVVSYISDHYADDETFDFLRPN
jgi:5-methylcytosine-specific restriction endonuclease McrA